MDQAREEMAGLITTAFWRELDRFAARWGLDVDVRRSAVRWGDHYPPRAARATLRLNAGSGRKRPRRAF